MLRTINKNFEGVITGFQLVTEVKTNVILLIGKLVFVESKLTLGCGAATT